MIEKLLSAWGAAVGLPAFVSTTFAEITGTRPRTFRQWAGDHAGEFLGPAARQRSRVQSLGFTHLMP